MLKELQEAVGQEDPSLRCITIGAQGKVFSAGHNLKELVSTIIMFALHHLTYLLKTFTISQAPDLQVHILLFVD